MFSPEQHLHFVGIGGSGLSAIARIFLERGYIVSGSDRATNPQTDALAADGATIYAGHDARHIDGADALIISSAIRDNPEVEAAQARGIPIYKRRDIMAPMMQGMRVIAVAGTHGKTTTTAMIAHILRECQLSPSYIVGGIMANTGTNAGVGTGDIFVIEADEYDNMYHGLRPDVIVLTSVEYDHPDFFTNEAQMHESFRRFVSLAPVPGEAAIYACADQPRAVEIAATGPQSYKGSYGFSPNADFMAEAVESGPDGSGFLVTLPLNTDDLERRPIGKVRLQVPGRHNIQNALGALAAVLGGLRTDITFDEVADALASFRGTGRRFEIMGETPAGVVVVDDYAHHPTAIKATLEAARSRYPDRTLWAVWQPHTFSRTESLLGDYADSFSDADQVLITDVYAARETPPPGATTTGFTAEIVKKVNHPQTRHTPALSDATSVLLAEAQHSAIIVIMSAGDAPRIGRDFLRGVGQ